VKISRKHCCVALVDHRFVVRDLDSMNGVWVNGDRVEHSADLAFGDELMIGDLPFTVARHQTPKPERRRPDVPAPPVARRPAPGSGTAMLDGHHLDEDDDDGEHTGMLTGQESFDENMLRSADSRDVVKFSSTFAIPLDDGESGEDFVIPLAELDD
jgi:predicted component of type VI protein secretion system